jgi:hypothetical protein
MATQLKPSSAPFKTDNRAILNRDLIKDGYHSSVFCFNAVIIAQDDLVLFMEKHF